MNELFNLTPRSIELYPSFGLTQTPFVYTSAQVAVLMGPQGEGKTFAGSWKLYLHAKEHFYRTGQRLQAVIVRDTFRNLERWTTPSILKALPFLVSPGKAGHVIQGEYLEAQLIGMQDATALADLQGAEAGYIWLEEPAPYVDRGNAGLAVEVFDVSLSRVGRQANSKPCLAVTMNPAHVRHWTSIEFLTNPRFPNKDFPGWRLETYRIPYGENVSNLSDHQRQGVKAAFSRNEALATRFIKGQTAYVYVGEAVTPEYNESIHKSGYDFEVIPGALGFLGLDGGLHPAAIIGQVSPTGHLLFMDSYVGENIGMTQLVDNWLSPMVTDKYKKVVAWRMIGDPMLVKRDDSDSSRRPLKLLEEKLKIRFEPGPVLWQPRREACKQALTMLVDGSPKVQISASDEYLSDALSGGWHYAKSNSGEVLRDSPVKDRHSHPGDCFSYITAVLLGIMEQQKKLRDLKQTQVRRPNWRKYA